MGQSLSAAGPVFFGIISVMLELRGKSLVTTDWHFGNKGDSPKYHRILVNSIREINRYADNAKIENFIFCGDMFHKRNMISVDTINIALKCLEAVSKHFKNVYLILGNHDLFNQSNTEIYSPMMFKSMKNVHIIDKGEEVSINGKKCLFSPWLDDLEKYGKNSFDTIFGHFKISEDYLVSSIGENIRSRKMTTEEVRKELENDELLRDSGLDELDFENKHIEETYVSGKKSSELIGSWIEIVKEGGTIFAGHIHRHKEFVSKRRKFIFIGSPYQQNMGERDSDTGFYELYEDGTYHYEKITDLPKHIDVRVSEILKNPEKFDYSALSGNIIHKIYDMEIDADTDARITRKIIDAKPYDELHPDYMISRADDGVELSSDAIDKLSKSPLEYLRSYVYESDEETFKSRGITRDEMFEFIKGYYEMAGGEA